MSSYNNILHFLNYVDANLNGNTKYIMGGGESTEPYDTYESILNNIFGYTRFIFGNNESNKQGLTNSIDELDKCRIHKEEICKDDVPFEKNDDNTTMNLNTIGFDQLEEPTGVLLRKGIALE